MENDGWIYVYETIKGKSLKHEFSSSPFDSFSYRDENFNIIELYTLEDDKLYNVKYYSGVSGSGIGCTNYIILNL